MDPKLAILFLLIGSIIVLSHLGEDNPARMGHRSVVRRWREFVYRWRKSQAN